MKSFYKTLFLVIWMIAMIGVGNSKAGPPKNATPIVTVNIVKKALHVVPVSNVIVTAIEQKADVTVKTLLQEKRPCYYYCIVSKTNNSFHAILAQRFYERDVSPGSYNSDIIPRCRSSDLI